jgi:replicative superfamily II helicase
MSNFIKVTEEMLPSRGRELVIRQQNFIKSFEVHLYTSLENGESRGIGEDAIRCVLYDPTSLSPIGKTKRVNRSEGSTTIWSRLNNRLEELKKLGGEQVICPKCSAHMVERTNGSTGETFYGCSAFPQCGRGQELRRQYSLVELNSQEKTKEKISEDFNARESYLDSPSNKIQNIPTFVNSTELMDEKDCIPTKDYPHIKYPFEKFNIVQSTILRNELHKKDINLVLGTTTSSGKTICAELFMNEILEKDKIVLYVSPLKSLTEEKNEEWIKTFGKKGYKICILTGDYILSERKAKELNEADIIVLTSEMIDSRSRKRDSEKSYWMKKVGLIIVDESHIISTSRGHSVEAGLMRFSRIVPEAKILCLSATLPNVEDFKHWMINLNGKKTEVINSTWRPVKLNWNFISYDTYLDYRGQQNDKIDKVLELIKSKPNEKFLCFVHDKNTGRLLEHRIKANDIETHFHSADLELEKRLEIERKFEDKDNGIRVLISTSTLAWGRNLPARNVIIVGVTRGLNSVDELDIIQEAGRAGRTGFDDEGFCYLICDDTRKWEYIVNHPRNIESTLLVEGILGFHILAEIKIGTIKDFNTLNDWFNRSLAFIQGKWDKNLVDRVITKLIKWNMLVVDPSGYYRITELGRVSADLYYLPQDIYHWSVEFNKVNSSNVWDNDLALSWALGSIPSKDFGYVPRDAQERVRSYSYVLRNLNVFRVFDSVVACDVYDAITGNELRFTIRGFRYDGERIAQALKWIDKIYRWGKKEIWDSIPIRLRYGIGRELVELCKLPGVGTKKAQRLWSLGIKSLDDINEKNRRKLNRALGYKLTDSTLKNIRLIKRRISMDYKNN